MAISPDAEIDRFEALEEEVRELRERVFALESRVVDPLPPPACLHVWKLSTGTSMGTFHICEKCGEVAQIGIPSSYISKGTADD